MDGETFLSPDGNLFRLADLRQRAQRGKSYDGFSTRFYARLVRALEQGELPDGWSRYPPARSEDDERASAWDIWPREQR
jgi:hypothetical protein